MKWGLVIIPYIISLYAIHHLYESHKGTEGFTHDRDLHHSYKL